MKSTIATTRTEIRPLLRETNLEVLANNVRPKPLRLSQHKVQRPDRPLLEQRVQRLLLPLERLHETVGEHFPDYRVLEARGHTRAPCYLRRGPAA